MRYYTAFSLLGLVLLSACGSSSAAVSGTVQGSESGLKSAIFYSTSATVSGTTVVAGSLIIGSGDSLCNQVVSSLNTANPNLVPPNENFLTIFVVQEGSALSSGTFSVVASADATTDVVAAYAKSDATGAVTTALAATSGSVTLTDVGSAAGSVTTGTFNLTLSTDDVLSGSFNADWCSALGNSATSS